MNLSKRGENVYFHLNGWIVKIPSATFPIFWPIFYLGNLPRIVGGGKYMQVLTFATSNFEKSGNPSMINGH